LNSNICRNLLIFGKNCDKINEIFLKEERT